MKLLLIHSNNFKWQAKEKALKEIEELKEKVFSTSESILVVFSAVEKQDESSPDKIAENSFNAIKSAAEEIKEKNIIVYPFVHLTEQPGSPRVAQKVLKKIFTLLSDDSAYNVYQAPFGYYKAFDLSNKGHPLSERSQIINVSSSEAVVEESKPDDVSKKEDLTALHAESASKSYFRILSQKGELFDVKEYKFAKDESKLKIFTNYEINKDRTSPEPPPHIFLMKKLEITDYEPGTDSGNFRFPPRGYIVKESIQERVKQYIIDYGAHIVTTPNFYDFEHPALKKYLNRFPARQYVLESGNKNFFMRFAACFGQFLALSQATISYKNLPVKVYELASSYRREQSGEISGLRRLRGFTMPDMHSVASDIPMAQIAFREQYELCVKMMKDFELDYEVAFRVQEDFFNEHKDWILEMIKLSGKNALLELFKERYAYFILKFEFNFVDSQNKAAALSTVQIDVENGERFQIRYVDEKGEENYPFILHCSVSGSVERDIYALLENASDNMKKGNIGKLPVWLSPVHVRILPVGEKHLEFSLEIQQKFSQQGIRAEIDDRLSERIGKRIRSSEKLWVPYTLVIGDKEVSGENLSVRKRGADNDASVSIDELLKEINSILKGYPRLQLAFPFLVSKQVIFSREV
jgi:threonyl-tRNA synthetase